MTRSLPSLSLPLALLLLLAAAGTALAHAELESATPGPDDEVVGSPTVLVAVFSQELDPSRTSLVIVDGAGGTVAEGGELGGSAREFRLELPELAPGEYEVRWTSFSAEDAELDRGTYTFTVLAAPAPTPTATPAVDPSPDGGSPGPDLGILIPIGAALLVAAAIVVWLLRRQAT